MKTGVTILEVMLAIVMLSVTAASVFPIMGWLMAKSRQLQYDSQAAVVMQEGMEAAYNVLLGDWEAMEAGRTYSPGVLFTGGGEEWTMIEGERMVEARFTRGITVVAVCRDGTTGQRVACGEGVPTDGTSKILRTTVQWKERGEDKVISGELLVTDL